ncbi:type VI secretion system tip protein VgrG [Acinetobacter towneri]|uniref:type VI secretion system Vgr family protein n=1 Tax=Acinetobacter towneri TaxID=202956 RepID=UPI001AA058D5|nr:type VI secretion system Vgr family protein [Acinetobacter towneri]QTD64295.1 type VI secretion system tip protein VgrG [Acinetobacter towneri]
MQSSLFAVLEKFGLSPQHRTIHIQFSNSALNHQVFLQCVYGQHAINQGLQMDVLCLSPHANLPLKQFIGSRVAVDQLTDQGELFRHSGIITAAAQGQSDGTLSLYKLQIQDATALWHKRRNSRVFMNKTVVEVSEILFKEWQDRSALFAASLSLDLSGLSQRYAVRPLIIQSNESDYEFLTRLWRSEGINWLVDEKQPWVEHFLTPMDTQKLRLIEQNSHYQPLKRRRVAFQRTSAIEQRDSIYTWMAQRNLQPTEVQLQRWQPDLLAQDQNSVQFTSPLQSSTQNSEALSLEQAWCVSPAWMQDLTGQDQVTAASTEQLEQLGQQLAQYYDLQAKYFSAQSNLRDAQVGYWFELHGHAEIDQHPQTEREFLILSKQFYNQNNLAPELQQHFLSLLQQSQWTFQLPLEGDPQQFCQLNLIRRHIALVPEFNPLLHRPVAYPQRAKVVGPEDETVHVDAWGRIKVRFLFTRSDDHLHDGGAGANDNESDSAWVDVLTPWAGEGYGARFHPRIGEIVVVDFFEGDIDRPFVVGRLHEAERIPTQFDMLGSLPDSKSLSGIRSQEMQGTGFNQLRFNDSTGQLSAQLQSSHAVSQLNLGALTHPQQHEQLTDRGEGFELRTDAFGAVRAGQGLLLSTHSQEQAQAHHLDVSAAKTQLDNSFAASQKLSELAQKQRADPLQTLDHLKAFINQIEQEDQSKAATFKQALMLLCAPHSIALSTHQDIHLSADQQIYQSAAGGINFSTQKSVITHARDKVSLFAAEQGISAFAAKGKVEIQAQDDGVDFFAREGIQIISTEGRIEISSPKEIVLTAGGSQIKINSKGVLNTTGGKFECKAGQHCFEGGERVASVQYSLPQAETEYSHQIDYQWDVATEDEKEIFVVGKQDGRLINTNKNIQDANQSVSSLRFYTSEKTEFVALGFNSSYVYLTQSAVQDNNIDELWAEIEEETELEEDEVYAEEDLG